MNQQFNPAMSIKELFEQIAETQMLLDRVNGTFTDNQLINKAFNLIFVTGVHNKACKEWQHWPTVEKHGKISGSISPRPMRSYLNCKKQHSKVVTPPIWQVPMICINAQLMHYHSCLRQWMEIALQYPA
eukprot:3524085-Ditylum_brightwellii.AAC.1